MCPTNQFCVSLINQINPRNHLQISTTYQKKNNNKTLLFFYSDQEVTHLKEITAVKKGSVNNTITREANCLWLYIYAVIFLRKEKSNHC